MSAVEIIDRNGIKYAKIARPRGQGRPLFRSLRTTSEAEARQKVKDARLEDLARVNQVDALKVAVWTALVAGRNVKVRDANEQYEVHRYTIGHATASIEHSSSTLDLFFRTFGLANQPIGAITADHVSRFVNDTSEVMLSTRQARLSIISAFLEFCVKPKGWLASNCALEVAVRVENLTQDQLMSEPREAFTEEQVQALLSAIPRADFWHGATLLGYHYGLRLGAVATLEEGNVVDRRLRLFAKKGRKIVDEPLHDDVQAWLDEWRKVRPASETAYLFPEQAALYVTGASFTLSRQFSRLREKHGLPESLSFHGLRKTATEKRWNAELAELGPRQTRLLTGMIARHGLQKVQQMLSHEQGSTVTERHYWPKT